MSQPNMTYNVGEIVQLRSGGPLMTVTKGGSAFPIHCMFHNTVTGLFATEQFTPNVLKLYGMRPEPVRAF